MESGDTPPEPLRTFARRLILEREEERQRVSDLIHNEVGQELSAMSLNLSLMQRSLTTSDAQALGRWLIEVGDGTQRTISQLRDLASEFELPRWDMVESTLRSEHYAMSSRGTTN